MTKYRCLTNPFYYCSGTPVFGEQETLTGYTIKRGKSHVYTQTIFSCKLDPKFCGFAQTFLESYDQTPSTPR